MTTQKGYIFGELDVIDHDIFYREYMPVVKPILEKYDARFVVSSNDVSVVEGNRNVKRVIIIEFETKKKALDFFYSKEYQDIIHLRLNSSKAHLYILEGALSE